MSNSVACAGCPAVLAVLPGSAGKVIRCPRCGTPNPIPAPEPSRPRPVRDRGGPRRRHSGGVPTWVWAAGSACLGLAVAVAVVVALGRRGREQPQVEPGPGPGPAQLAAQGMAPETWVRRTHEPSGTTWEFPTTGEVSPTVATVRLADQKGITFSVYITDVPARDKQTPGFHPLAKLRAVAAGGPGEFGAVERTGTIDGRPFVVTRSQRYPKLIAADYDRRYEFWVAGADLDDGGQRVERFFASIRIGGPLPGEPASPPAGAVAAGEAIPPWWDRVRVPGSTVTLLVPQWTAPSPFQRLGIPAGTVSRSLITADGDEILVAAHCTSGNSLDSQVVAAMARGVENRAVTAGGRPARLSVNDYAGVRTVSLVMDLGAQKTAYVLFFGARVDPDGPEVRRVIDSVSLTLPPKPGPESSPEGPPRPAWVRRFAPKGTFSVEMPGRSSVNEAGVGLGGGVSWGAKGFIPLPGRKQAEFLVTAVGGPAPNLPNPWQTIQREAQNLAGGLQFVRWVEVGGRPAYLAAKVDKDGYGHVHMKIQDVLMAYTLDVAAPGATPDVPEVRRFLESASFAVLPNGPPR